MLAVCGSVSVALCVRVCARVCVALCGCVSVYLCAHVCFALASLRYLSATVAPVSRVCVCGPSSQDASGLDSDDVISRPGAFAGDPSSDFHAGPQNRKKQDSKLGPKSTNSTNKQIAVPGGAES